jgi:hypothetical protein
MSYVTPFLQNGTTRAITAAATAPTAVQILPTFTSALGPRNQFRVVNAGDEIAFLGTGPTAALAEANAAPVTSTGDAIPMLPGAVEIFSLVPDWYFTARTASGTSQIYITPGEGL